MKEVSGRMFALCAEVARLGGVDDPLLFLGLDIPRLPGPPGASSVDAASRADFGTFLSLLARLRERLGSDEALAGTFARSPAALPELVAFAADFSSPLELSRFFNTVLVPGYFTCLHTVMAATEDGAYDLWLVLHPGYAASAPLVHALAGVLRGLPRFLDLDEASVITNEEPRAISFRVRLPTSTGKPRKPSKLRAVDDDRAHAFIDALVSDGEAYRRGATQTEEALATLGRATESAPSRVAFARVVVDVLVRALALPRCVLRLADGTTALAEASKGPRSAATRVVDVALVGEKLGTLEVPATCSREALDALLPLVAWGLHRRALDEPTEPAGVVPAVYVRPAWRLTKRQTEVVALVVAGLSNAQIAARLGCAVGTIEDRLTAIYAKTGVDGRLGLAVRVLEARSEAPS